MTENGTVRDFTVEMRRRESPMSEWNRFESDELRKVSIRVNRFMERFCSCAKMKIKPCLGILLCLTCTIGICLHTAKKSVLMSKLQFSPKMGGI